MNDRQVQSNSKSDGTDLRTACGFNIPYVYEFITQLRMQKQKSPRITPGAIVRNIGQGKAMHKKYMRLKSGGGQDYDRSSD
jgi:hypothetical protein